MKKFLSSKLWKIAAMEFRLTAANRAFVIMTLLGPFLIVAMSVLPSLLSMRGGGGTAALRTVAVVGADEQTFQTVSAALAPSNIQVLSSASTEGDLDAAVLAGELYGYLVVPADLLATANLAFVSTASGDWQTVGTLQASIGSLVVSRRLVERGVDSSEVSALLAQPQVEVRRLTRDGEKESQDFATALFTGLAFTFLLYMTVLLYGQAIGRSVVIEKTSKTVEIMLSSVRTGHLMFGKLLGKAAASLLQYAVWILMAALFLGILAPMVHVNIPLVGGARTMIFLVIFFLIAFFLYAAVYAGLGAASEDEQHLGQLSWPVIVFLVFPMVAIGALTQYPDGTLSVVLSFFPLTAPIVMFQRVVLGNPAVWEVVLSIGGAVATTAAIIALSARIFRVGILMTGKRYRLGEVLKWVAYR